MYSKTWDRHTWIRLRYKLLLLIVGLVGVSVSAFAMQIGPELDAAFDRSFEPRLETEDSGTTYLFEGTHLKSPAMTMRTKMTINNVTSGSGVQEIYLAGLSVASDEDPTIALVWVQTGVNWFGPVWSLELRAADASLQNKDSWSGSTILTDVTPQTDHEYETYVSYDTNNGALSLLVTDLTNNETVYKGEHQLTPYDSPLLPWAGFHTSAQLTVPSSKSQASSWANSLVSIQSIGSIPVFLPIGHEWVIGHLADRGAILPVSRFGWDETIDLQVPPVATEQGSFRLFIKQTDGTTNPLDTSTTPTDDRMRLLAADLPPGTWDLHLEYIDSEGEVLLTDYQTVTVGEAVVRVSPLQVDREAAQLHGTLKAATDGPEIDATLGLVATFTRTEWDQDQKRYNEVASVDVTIPTTMVTLAQSGTSISFTLPFPDPDNPGLWEVSLQPQIELSDQVPIVISGELSRLFTTYSPAQNLDTRPFTLVMMPDTQEYPKAYPDIFTRQTEWIAAHANELNIGAVLHVGDIVDNNDTRQWTRASRSLHVLDGVVPYVLAVGNHDVRVAFTPQRSLFDREGSLINTYFTVPNAEANSNLGGVFTPDRLENSYSLFSFGGTDYLVLSLEWGPRDSVLDWANDVLTAYPDHKVIIITHAFTAPDGGWVTPDRFPVALPPENDFIPGPSTVNSAATIWSKLINQHSNVFMVLSGHMGTNAIAFRSRTGEQGNTVFEMMANYQTEENGGNGWLVLLTFTPDDRIIVQAFSPYLCAHRRDFNHYGFGHNFVIDVESGLHIPFNTEVYGHCGG